PGAGGGQRADLGAGPLPSGGDAGDPGRARRQGLADGLLRVVRVPDRAVGSGSPASRPGGHLPEYLGRRPRPERRRAAVAGGRPLGPWAGWPVGGITTSTTSRWCSTRFRSAASGRWTWAAVRACWPASWLTGSRRWWAST